eukprot:m.652514 g.652514  ORF g.652514 m.652514 type:complete len:95 (+) comp58399_c1_seq61:3380-3664(+)
MRNYVFDCAAEPWERQTVDRKGATFLSIILSALDDVVDNLAALAVHENVRSVENGLAHQKQSVCGALLPQSSFAIAMRSEGKSRKLWDEQRSDR